MIIIKTWQARKRHSITLVKLSEMTGISKTTLNDIENGKISPNLNQIEKIAIALNVSLSDLYESVRES